uniref:Uncharacterized protein n=1 Tax=Eutreptiella gymnastica TaxID=73025 RepID=A0A6T1ZDH7_9EUGL
MSQNQPEPSRSRAQQFPPKSSGIRPNVSGTLKASGDTCLSGVERASLPCDTSGNIKPPAACGLPHGTSCVLYFMCHEGPVPTPQRLHGTRKSGDKTKRTHISPPAISTVPLCIDALASEASNRTACLVALYPTHPLAGMPSAVLH